MSSIGEKLHRGWRVFKHSVQVIREHPKLLVFPAVTAVLTLTIACFFLAPAILVLLVPNWVQAGIVRSLADSIGFLKPQGNGGFHFAMQPLGSALLAVVYLVNMFIATMASVAFNSEIIEALAGRPVSIAHGVQVACSRWKAVLFWSLLAGLVGLVIRKLEERFSIVGRLVAGLVGVAWSMASIFAIPIIAREPALTNPFDVLVKSAEVIKRTWGEMLAGYVGVQGTNLLVLGLSLLYWLGAGGLAYAISNPWILAAAGGAWLVAILAYAYLASIASRVYLCALYLYAAEGVLSANYDAELMNAAWKLKKGV